jgi:putative intracellular protease/amidase
MKKRTAAFFVFDGFADWSTALALSLLRRRGDFCIKSFSEDGEPVVSAGGLLVQPACYADQLRAEHTDVLILPCGDAWEQGRHRTLLPMVEEMVEYDKTVAAIGDAVLLPAAAGMLDCMPHTADGLSRLQEQCPSYDGAPYYRKAPCVNGGTFITAAGEAMIEFAFVVAAAMKIMETRNSLPEMAEMVT